MICREHSRINPAEFGDPTTPARFVVLCKMTSTHVLVPLRMNGNNSGDPLQ